MELWWLKNQFRRTLLLEHLNVIAGSCYTGHEQSSVVMEGGTASYQSVQLRGFVVRRTCQLWSMEEQEQNEGCETVFIGSNATRATSWLVQELFTAADTVGSWIAHRCVLVSWSPYGKHTVMILLLSAPRCDISGMGQILYGVARAELGGAIFRYSCEPGGSLVGEQALFCDGTSWNGTKPYCSVPPPAPVLSFDVDGNQNADTSLNFGQKVRVLCQSSGGNPPPTIAFVLDEDTVDQSLLETTEQGSFYTFTAFRNKTSLLAACKAENSASDVPVYSQNIKFVLRYAPESVAIIGKDTLVVGEEAHYSCESGESNPASDVTLVIRDQDGQNVQATQTKMKKAVADGFVTRSIYSFKIVNRVKILFMECRAVNQVGMAISDKAVHILYAPLHVEITGPVHLLQNETQTFGCTVADSNPAADISWFVVLGEEITRLGEEKTETVRESSGSGGTVVSRAAVSAPDSPSVTIFCTAEVASLGYKKESNRLVVEILRYPEQLSLTSPPIVVKDREATIKCSAKGKPTPSTSLVVSSLENESISVRKEDVETFSFLVSNFTDQVEVTCTAANMAGSLQQSVHIPVVFPAEDVTIIGPDYIIQDRPAVFSCQAREGIACHDTRHSDC